MRRTLRPLLLLAALAAACSGSSAPPPAGPAPISFEAMGSLSAASGKGHFRFGVATAATQIEDHDTNTDWYVFTEPVAMGGLGKGAAFVDNAVDGYTLALSDIELLKALHVDSYRFGMEWARIEPEEGMIDEDALSHYSGVLDALVAAHIRPLVTVHHFANPVWVDDPRDTACTGGPSSKNLCGLGDPIGGPMVIAAFAAHAKLLATRFGDRVDEWGLVNEPVNYLFAAYGVGEFPPGKTLALGGDLLGQFVPVIRDYLSAYVAMYDAVKAADTVDADGDGVAANVGMSLSTEEWVPAASNKLTSNPTDVMAQGRIEYLYNHLWVDSLLEGNFDPNLDGMPSEAHPDWKGKIDWLGVQYYSRAGVTSPGILPVVNLTPCVPPLDLGSCVPPLDPTFCVPVMQYEYDPAGLYDILTDFGKRWPSLPLVVSEHGLQTRVDDRRVENLVRGLEQIDRALAAGVDVRGYYEWSLLDNFEWALGFVPRFGLYSVDDTTYARTPTTGSVVFGGIAASRSVTSAQRSQYGGTGPLTPEAGGINSEGLCKTP
jgi:beta-glucosidase